MTVPFQPFAAAAEPYFIDRYTYVTDVLQSENGTEQRAQVIAVPVREVVVPVRTIGVDVYRLMALLYGGASFNVPLWPRGTYLQGGVVAGSAKVFTVAATANRIAVGTPVFLWHPTVGPEVVTVTAVSATTFTATTAITWPSGAFVIPTVPGHLSGDTEVGWLGPTVAQSAVSFRITGVTDPAVSTPTEASVFNVAPYIRRDQTQSYTRLVDRLEFPATGFTDYARRNAAIGSRPFNVWLSTRVAIDALVAWFHGQKGRLAPFYLPTYHPDFTVVSGLGTTSLVVQHCLYTALSFPDVGRRHLAFIAPSGVVTQRTVTGAVDNGNQTETLTLSSAAPASPTMVSYALYGRLASDTLEIRWRGQSFADCDLAMVETPAELALP